MGFLSKKLPIMKKCQADIRMSPLSLFIFSLNKSWETLIKKDGPKTNIGVQ